MYENYLKHYNYSTTDQKEFYREYEILFSQPYFVSILFMKKTYGNFKPSYGYYNLDLANFDLHFRHHVKRVYFDYDDILLKKGMVINVASFNFEV